MAANRLSSLNIVLLIVTVASLMIAVYGFIQRGGAHNSRNNSNSNIDISADVCADDGKYRTIDGHCVDRGGPHTKPGDNQPAGNQPGTHVDGGKVDIGSHSQPDGLKPLPDPNKPSDSGNANLSGVVLDSNGAPAAGVNVEARRSDIVAAMPMFNGTDYSLYRAEMTRYMKELEGNTRRTTSGQDGKFTFSGLDPKLAYDLFAFATAGGNANQARVAAGDKVTLLLSANGTLQGRVLDFNGKPAANFTIEIRMTGQAWVIKQQAFTTSDGSFSMPCALGDRQITATAPGRAPSNMVNVKIDPNGAEIELRLVAAAILSGVVTDKSGRPLANATVSAQPDAGASESSKSSSNGSFDDNSWYSVDDGGKDTVELSFNTNDANGLRSFVTSVARNDLNGWQGNQTQHTAITDSQGRYRMDDLAPGKYNVTAYYGEANASEKATLAVGENKKDFKLDAGVTASLKFTDSTGSAVEPENVWFQKADGSYAQPMRLPAKERGLYEYSGIKAGDYTIHIQAQGLPVATHKESLKEGAANAFAYQLAQGAMLKGKLTGSGDVVIGLGFSVRLHRPNDPGQNWGAGYAQCQQDGTFKVGPVEAGEYEFQILDGNQQVVFKEKITLAVGDNQYSNSVDTGGTLRVTTVGDDGKPSAWCSGNLRMTDGKSNYSGWSNDQGLMSISFITPGEYTLTVTSQSGQSVVSKVYIHNGVNDTTVTVKAPNCMKISSITPGSQAEQIGLQVGDLMIEYNGHKITGMNDVYTFVRETKTEDQLTMVIDRNGSVMTFSLHGGLIGITGDDATR